MPSLIPDEITVGDESWHYKLYKWWASQTGGNRYGYTENFCHYVRVIVFWVPFLFLFQTSLYKWVRPYMLVAAVLGTATYILALNKWPEVTVVLSLIVIGILLCVGIVIGLLVGIAFVISRNEETAKKVGTMALIIITMPIVFPLYYICVAVSRVWNRYNIESRIVSVLHWYFFTQKWYVVFPWSVTIIGLLVLSLIIMGWLPTLFGVITLVVSLIVIALIVGFVILCVWIIGMLNSLNDRLSIRRIESRYHSSSEQISSAAPVLEKPTTPLYIMIWEFLKSIKQQVCPTIRLPEEIDERPKYINY